MGRPLWREDGSVIYSKRRCHSRVQITQNIRPNYTVSFETGFTFCLILRLVGLRWKYCNPPSYEDYAQHEYDGLALSPDTGNPTENTSSADVCSLAIETRLFAELLLRRVLQLLVNAYIFPSSMIHSNLMMVALRSSEASALTRVTRRHIPEDSILHTQRPENLKCYIITRLFHMFEFV
jgi:hypothetical protein